MQRHDFSGTSDTLMHVVRDTNYLFYRTYSNDHLFYKLLAWSDQQV